METWKPVVGYEGIYEVSNLGRVKSLARVKMCGHPGTQQMTKEKMLKIRTDRIGYSRVKLSKNGVSKLVPLHRVVAMAFVDNPFNKNEVNHIDGNKKNNTPENLEWVTRSENIKHAFEKKLKIPITGERNNKSKLTEIDVKEIRKLRRNGRTLQEIANIYKVSAANISNIVNNKTWKEVR